jgi:hypothetical protein
MSSVSSSRSGKNSEPPEPQNLSSTGSTQVKPTSLINSKTTLEDISAVVGLTATLRLSAWFGNGLSNAYVPHEAAEGQLIVKLIGLPAAKALSKEWGGEHLAVPRLRDYEDDMRKKAIGRMFERGFGSREIAAHLRITERRVQQICRELEQLGLIEIVGPRELPEEFPEENEGEFIPEKTPGKLPRKTPAQSDAVTIPTAFFSEAVPMGQC